MADLTKVPFGKYKDQPVEALAADQGYVEWLLSQAWVKDRYPQFFTLIINNLQEPTETPEHNALQARFLDDDFCARCYWAAGRRGNTHSVLSGVSADKFEYNGIDVILAASYWRWSPPVWEEYYQGVSVEIKPTLGDEYPAVLRQALRLYQPQWGELNFIVRGTIVCFETFTARGATLAQVKTIFERSDITLVSFADIEAARPVCSREAPPPLAEAP
jgi:hypothetical protein